MPGQSWTLLLRGLAPLRQMGWRKGTLAIFLTVCGLWTAWMVVSLHLSRHFSLVAPQIALKWRDDYAPALDARALQELQDGAVADARATALDALRAAPMDWTALAILSEADEREGNDERAGAILEEAGRRTLRDPAIQAKLIVRALERGDVAQALPRIDALLRAKSPIDNQLYDLLVNLVAQPSYRPDVVARLALRPSWRGGLMGRLSRGETSDVFSAVLADLKATEGPPTEAEMKLYLRQLVRLNEYEKARSAWRSYVGVSEDEGRNGNRIVNPGFDHEPNDMPFDWETIGTVNTELSVVPRPGRSDSRVMRVTFLGGRVDFSNLRQLLVLEPGNFLLSGSVRTEGLQNERGLVWQVSCRDSGAVLVRTPAIKGTMPWTTFEVPFTVPDEKCQAQQLTLLLASRVALDQQISGVIWLDDMSIVRTEAAPATGRTTQ